MLFIVQKRGARAATFHVLFNAFRDLAEFVNTLNAERCIVLDFGFAIEVLAQSSREQRELSAIVLAWGFLYE